METGLIYRCIKIIPFYGTEIEWGYFRKNTNISKILSSEKDEKSQFFYEVTGWILDPPTPNQRMNWITLSTYLSDGSHYCTLQATRYALHPNRLENIQETQFKGRDANDIQVQKGERCWYYDHHLKLLCLGRVIETPPLRNENLSGEWEDDSYMIETGSREIYVLSPYVFKYSQFI